MGDSRGERPDDCARATTERARGPQTALHEVYGWRLEPDSAWTTARRFNVARNPSLVQELQEMLPKERRGRVQSGQVRVDFEGPQLGSSRAYLHWYNEHGLTSSHEKFGLTIPAVGGYWTVPNVHDSDSYRVYLALVNLDEAPYTSTVLLKDADGQPLTATLALPTP